MQTSEDEYNEKMKARIEKMKKDPLDEVTSEYKERGKNLAVHFLKNAPTTK